jgi:hypothetical protein
LRDPDIDFFIVENRSENSKRIEDYFSKQKIRGYIQFLDNIAASAMTIFIRNFSLFLDEYDIITFTDGDIYAADGKDTFTEIIENLSLPEVAISAADLFMENNYIKSNRIIGIENFREKMTNRNVEYGHIQKWTGNILLTLKKQDLYIVKDIHYVDTNIHKRVREHNKKWVATNKNLVYHITWDHYVEGNEYYEWKKKVYPQIWTDERTSEYRRIL